MSSVIGCEASATPIHVLDGARRRTHSILRVASMDLYEQQFPKRSPLFSTSKTRLRHLCQSPFRPRKPNISCRHKTQDLLSAPRKHTMARKTYSGSSDGKKRWTCCGARSRTPLCLLGLCVAPRMRDPPEHGMGTRLAVGAAAIGVVGAIGVAEASHRRQRHVRRKGYYY